MMNGFKGMTHLLYPAGTRAHGIRKGLFDWLLIFALTVLSGAVFAQTTVSVTVTDSASAPQPGLSVYAFDGAAYTGNSGVTDANGIAQITLADGSYRFRIDKNGTQFFTDAANHCTTPSCTSVSHQIPENITVTVTGSAGGPETGLSVYAFNGSTYANKSAVTNASGTVTFTLLPGDYRFRIDKNGTQYFTDTVNHCTAPGCTAVAYEIPEYVTVTVTSSAGGAETGLSVYAFNGATYINKSAVTNASGTVTFTLLPGDYRFRIDKNGTQYFTDSVNHCTTPGCNAVAYEIPEDVTVTVTSSAGGPETGLMVYAFNGATYTGKSAVTNASGTVTFTLLPGDYRFRIDKNGTQFYTDTVNHCTTPGCNAVTYEIPENVTVTVTSSAGGVEAGLSVFAFSGSTYTGKTAVTNASGTVTFTLLPGDYRFRIDKNGTQYFTDAANHCTTPGCNSVAYEIPENVTVTVTSSAGGPETGLSVYAFNGSTYTGKSAVTNGAGEATFTLLPGDYRFRIDKNGTQFFTDSVNHCTAPGCNAVAYEIPENVTVTVTSSAGGPETGLTVYAFNGSTYTGKSAVTDGGGDAVFTLLPGNYRFRIDKSGTQYFTNAANHCAVPGCNSVSHLLPAALSLYVTDPALGACLDAAGAANGWTTPGEVTDLNCDGLGITNLAGLDTFANLGNLSLANNPVTLVTALSGLGNLTGLNLSGVNSLECSQLGALVGSLGSGVVTEPASCFGEGEIVFSVANPGSPDTNQFGFALASTSQGHLIASAITYHAGTDSYDGTVTLIDGTSGAELLEFANPAPSGSDYFGWAVAATPGNDIVVGAWQDEAGGVAAGAVHLFDGADGSLLDSIDNPSPTAGDQFGYAVIGLPDGSLAVGAPGKAGGGAVYLFADTGSLVQTLTNPTGDANADFGSALTVTGQGELVVGAPGQDVGAYVDAGAVHVFENLGGSLVLAQTIEHPEPTTADAFGAALAAGNGDIVVSAPGRDNIATDDGSIYVLDASTGIVAWSAANPVGDVGGAFAASLAISPQGHVIAGAPRDDFGADDAGRVFVFNGLDGSLIARLDSPAPTAGGYFGQGLAITPYGQIAVGAFGADGGYGEVYWFTSIATGSGLTTLNSLYSSLTFPDTNLETCVQDHAAVNGWATVDETASLDCSDRGIADVTGLSTLTALQSLDLSLNNDILCTDLDALEAALPTTMITRPDPCSTGGGVITETSVQNLHNAAGQRVVKTVNGDPSTAVHFLYDRQGRVIAEMEAATGNTLREYIYINGQQIALVDDTGTPEEAVYYVHNDYLGTPQKLTDDSQQTVWAADYEPFGKANITLNTIDNNIRFPGQYKDQESGLHYNYHRDYDPSLGRYVESDPIGLKAGLNTYAYVESNPIDSSDPSGLVSWKGSLRLGSGSFGANKRFRFRGGLLPGNSIILDLESQCVNGSKVEVRLFVDNISTDIVSLAYLNGDVNLEDGAATPNANNLRGEFNLEVSNGTFNYLSGVVSTGRAKGWFTARGGSTSSRFNGRARFFPTGPKEVSCDNCE